MLPGPIFRREVKAASRGSGLFAYRVLVGTFVGGVAAAAGLVMFGPGTGPAAGPAVYEAGSLRAYALIVLAATLGIQVTFVALLAAAVVAIYLFEGLYTALAHPGNEQGLTPAHWEPRHAAAYVANAVVICTWVPFVEELTFRGLGYSLLARFGTVPAIVLVGILFGLSHGLLLDLPVLVIFGCVLAWVRVRTGSVFPGMVLHGLFNLIALVVAVAF